MQNGDSPACDVVAAFEERARTAPDAVAVSDQGRSTTYAELDQRSGELARQFAARGVGPGTLVGLCLPRGLGLVTALLGCLKSGAAYLPLDPALPEGRLHALLSEARADLVLVDDSLSHELSVPDTQVVPLASFAGTDELEPGRRTVDATTDLAYVIFTSGSTGESKPVAVSRTALSHHAVTMAAVFDLTPRDRVVQFASPAFDVAAEEIFPTLASGACVAVLPDQDRSPRDLERFLREEGVTVANLPSSYWATWVADLDAEPRTLPACLRLLVVGSEIAHTRTLARWRRHCGIPVINAYGLTEMTITAFVSRFSGQDMPSGDVLPIGHPLPGVVAHVLDAALRPVPHGTVGELYLGGVTLARGYHRRPDLTETHFLEGAVEAPGTRLYRTGDRVVEDADGALTCLGRIDDQVKIRGHRVEPAEVTAALLALPGVAQAHVRPLADERGTRLAAYVVADSGTGSCVQSSELRAALALKLPAAMVPTEIMRVPELPLTVSGKVDVRALPLPVASVGNTAAGAGRSMAPTEQKVAEVWCEALGTSWVHPDANFFDLGGHSLLLVQVRRRLSDAFGRPIFATALFEHPTVRSLARFLDEALTDAVPAASPEADRGDVRRQARSRIPRSVRHASDASGAPVQGHS
ncbi:non-ribosomal peptide synthetase [Streptomyces sp. B3I8]|uniref:non-ribosomal peptide synthetase n=1 Tax=Streptomyces sp. B3I8 TaxID=3042303 RepID=UPI0027D91F2E|nr:non-ribosomal peptide synthetase [Streptomyces sp. B3I8]